jgi:hypothetical protein
MGGYFQTFVAWGFIYLEENAAKKSLVNVGG